MVYLNIKGHFSYIDPHGKLKFTWLEDDSHNKLISHCSGLLPYNEEGFTLTMPKRYKTPTPDIISMLGRDVLLNIKIHKYSFISKLQKNLNEYVSGTQLILQNIQLI